MVNFTTSTNFRYLLWLTFVTSNFPTYSILESWIFEFFLRRLCMGSLGACLKFYTQLEYGGEPKILKISVHQYLSNQFRYHSFREPTLNKLVSSSFLSKYDNETYILSDSETYVEPSSQRFNWISQYPLQRLQCNRKIFIKYPLVPSITSKFTQTHIQQPQQCSKSIRKREKSDGSSYDP